MARISDMSLVRRSRAGDPSAFAELVRRHAGSVVALIRFHVKDPYAAEDLFQEALLQAWKGLPLLRSPDRFRAWLLQVARNRVSDFFRSSKRQEQPAEEDQIEIAFNRFGRAAKERRDKTDEVVDALQTLSQAERDTAKLFYLEGLSIAEIAKRDCRPEGTIKRRLFSARQHLREALGVKRKEKRK